MKLVTLHRFITLCIKYIPRRSVEVASCNRQFDKNPKQSAITATPHQ
jgi:hypothetical protein